MSGSKWMITPLWLSKTLRHFLYSYSVCSCHLFLVSSASVRSTQFLSFIEPIFAWNVPLVSLIFLKRYLVLPVLFFSLFIFTVHLRRLSYLSFLFPGTLHSDGYICPFFFCLSLLFFSQLFVRAPQTIICLVEFLFCGDSFVPRPIQCYEPPSIVLQALHQV